MNCLFCKNASDSSKSLEHILPESLGNKEHVLRPGVVCDKCNNYFSIKVEKIVLDKPYYRNVRHRNLIKTKKDRLVAEKALFPHKNAGWVDFWKDESGFILSSEDDHIVKMIMSGELNKVIIPIIDMPEEKDVDISRFVTKVGLEFLASKYQTNDEWLHELVNKLELDPIRRFARYGEGEFWEYNLRRIYTENDLFVDPINHPEPYEILHEFDLLYTESNELYFVLVIMGIEYVINLGGSDIEGYKKWLKNNNNISPVRRYSEVMLKSSQ